MKTSYYADSRNQSAVGSLESRFLGVICWMPAVAVVMLVCFAAIASFQAGHLPYYSNPDPKELRLPLLHAAALLSYPLAFVTIPIALFTAVLSFDSMKRRDMILLTFGVAAWAFILPIAGRLLVWLLD